MDDTGLSSTQLQTMLNPAEAEVLGERVYCDDELALSWEAVPALPQELLINRINGRNETVLRAMSMLEEHDDSPADDAERAELHRLEGKLDVALELLAELVRDQQTAIPTCPVRFNSRGLCFDAPQAPGVGTLLLVECYALPAWPVALKFHARVRHVQGQGEGYRVCVRLEGLSLGVREWLDKLVFRRHRRSIAQSRTVR